MKQQEKSNAIKAEKLYDAISDIRDEFIQEAEPAIAPKKHMSNWLKWGGLAACFCLVFLAAGLFLDNGLLPDGVSDNNKTVSPTPPPGGMLMTVFAYNGALFQVSNELSVLNVAGIPDMITSEDCGEMLGNLKKTELGYEETAADTDIAFYKYAAASSNTAVLVIRDGEDYMAGLFSNTLENDTEESQSTISALYKRYGVESAAHMISVAEVVMQNKPLQNSSLQNSSLQNSSLQNDSLQNDSLQNNSLLDNALIAAGSQVIFEITEQTALEEFYKITASLEEETYPYDVFESRYLCITTSEGLKFYLSWDRERGFLYSSGTMAFYRIPDELKNWLEIYLVCG